MKIGDIAVVYVDEAEAGAVLDWFAEQRKRRGANAALKALSCRVVSEAGDHVRPEDRTLSPVGGPPARAPYSVSLRVYV